MVLSLHGYLQLEGEKKAAAKYPKLTVSCCCSSDYYSLQICQPYVGTSPVEFQMQSAVVLGE